MFTMKARDMNLLKGRMFSTNSIARPRYPFVHDAMAEGIFCWQMAEAIPSANDFPCSAKEMGAT